MFGVLIHIDFGSISVDIITPTLISTTVHGQVNQEIVHATVLVPLLEIKFLIPNGSKW